MSDCKQVPEGKDPVLWNIAQKRASFKRHAATYTIVNLFLWGIWYFTGSQDFGAPANHYPWPIWTTLGWGVGLAFNYAAAYINPQGNLTETEYQKLKNNH